MRGSRRVIQGYVKVIVIVPLALIIGIIGCNLFSDPEITIYPARIQNAKLIIGNRTTLRVSVDRQEIVYWSPDVKHSPLRLRDCVVITRKNWSGKYIDGFGSVLMIAGRFYQYPYYPTTIYISRWGWWFNNMRLVGRLTRRGLWAVLCRYNQ